MATPLRAQRATAGRVPAPAEPPAPSSLKPEKWFAPTVLLEPQVPQRMDTKQRHASSKRGFSKNILTKLALTCF